MATNSDQALRELMANKAADPAQRAAAFEANYPGINVRVGEAGELSFSNVEGRDVYGPYMKATAQTDEGKAALTELLGPTSGAAPEVKATAIEALGPEGTLAKANPDGTIGVTQVKLSNPFESPVNTNDLFAQQYRQLSELTDPTEIINARANLVQSTESWIVNKSNQLKEKARQGNGVAALEAELQRSIQLDKQAYADFNDGIDLGDSDETMAVRRQLEGLEQKSELEASKNLAADPEIAGARARMQAVDMLVQSKMTAELQATEGQGKADKLLGQLILPEQIAAVQTSLGMPAGAALDPMVEKELKAELVSGKAGPLTLAMETGLTADKGALVVNSMKPGTQGVYATNVLKAQIGDDSLVKLVKDTTAAELAGANKPVMGKDGKPALVQPPSTTEAKAANEAAAIQAARDKVGIQRNNNFLSAVDQWQAPQDPNLQGKVKSAVDMLKNAEQPVTLDAVVSRMTLTREDGKLDSVQLQQVADWYYSQAQQVPGNSFFGPPPFAGTPTEARTYIESLAVKQLAVDKGLVGSFSALYRDELRPYFPPAIVADTVVLGAMQIFQGIQTGADVVFGTGKPIDAASSEPAKGFFDGRYNPARVDVNYEIVTDYYRGRAGVDPAWIAERDANIAAAKRKE